MSKQKIKNARKVDRDGNEISKLKEWKKLHPNEIYYDSLFEYKATVLFTKSGINYVYQPEPFVLIPKFSTKTFDFGSEDKKEYNRLKRGKKGTEKAKITREFNKNHKKILTDFKYARPLTWAPDFYLPEYDIYVEIKGHPNDVFPVKLKLAQYLLSDEILIVIYTMKDLTDFVDYLFTKTEKLYESITRTEEQEKL
mgnify:CR=1 FL=1